MGNIYLMINTTITERDLNMKEYNCPVCKGRGEYHTITNALFAHEIILYPVKCDYCNGTGKVTKGQLYTKKRKG